MIFKRYQLCKSAYYTVVMTSGKSLLQFSPAFTLKWAVLHDVKVKGRLWKHAVQTPREPCMCPQAPETPCSVAACYIALQFWLQSYQGTNPREFALRVLNLDLSLLIQLNMSWKSFPIWIWSTLYELSVSNRTICNCRAYVRSKHAPVSTIAGSALREKKTKTPSLLQLEDIDVLCTCFDIRTHHI